MITIGIPRGHFSAPWGFTQSLIDTIINLTQKKLYWQLLTSEGAIIEENRNDLFSKNIPNYLLMIDDDMVFSNNEAFSLWNTMVDKKLDICCGLFFTGEPGLKPAIFKNEKCYENYPPHSVFEVDACGMAFTMFSKKVLEAFKGKQPFKRMEGLGEDLSFCKRAQDKGFKIYCNPGIKIGHLRIKAITEKNLDSWRVEEELWIK